MFVKVLLALKVEVILDVAPNLLRNHFTPLGPHDYVELLGDYFLGLNPIGMRKRVGVVALINLLNCLRYISDSAKI